MMIPARYLSIVGLATGVMAMPLAAEVPIDSPVRDALLKAEAAVDAIVQMPTTARTFDNTVGAIDDIVANLEIDTNMMQFMAYVSPDKDIRDLGQRAEQDVRNWFIDLAKNEALYNAVRAYADKRPQLEGEQKRLLEHTLRDYKRAGMMLSGDQREKLTAVQKELTKLSIDFEKNIREDSTRVLLTRDELTGLPDDYFDQLTESNGVYLVDMSYPQFLPVQDYCDNELTRKKMWLAYKRRGGEKNVQTLQQILELRAEASRMLGYSHPADYEIEVKMAKNADNVMSFYEKLRPLVRRKARLDYEEFVGAKRDHTGRSDAVLYPWDASYYENKLRAEKYAVDPRKVQEYFPLDRCIDGLFGITQSLYGIEYRDETHTAEDSLWHEDVSYYSVWDKASGQLLGHFYLDLHPRQNKYGHAAQWGLQQHKVWSDGTVQKPLAALVCNFTKPTSEKPSLLTHDEVETFFHEFGHCLHTILSETHYWQFAGTSVERDFVEAPSQMFENWVWDGDALALFARHYKTNEPFPDHLLKGMLRARHLGSGMKAERQFFYGMFDMKCHLDPSGSVNTTDLAHELWGSLGEGVELYAAVPETYFQAAFGHLTGYQAGYYGYQWSLVYACDMFQRFKELGMLSPDAGMYYRKKILARGGTMDGLDLVRDYLGREPDMASYLRHLGLEP